MTSPVKTAVCPRPSFSRFFTATLLEGAGSFHVVFSAPYPLDAGQCALVVERSADLENWIELPTTSHHEVSRIDFDPTARIIVRVDETLPGTEARTYYRARWANE